VFYVNARRIMHMRTGTHLHAPIDDVRSCAANWLRRPARCFCKKLWKTKQLGDGESLAAFEKDLENNLYKIWNRISSGLYFPPPVRLVEVFMCDSSSPVAKGELSLQRTRSNGIAALTVAQRQPSRQLVSQITDRGICREENVDSFFVQARGM